MLFRGGEEGSIRRSLIERSHIDTIIGLPANIFFGTGIPTIIMVLRQQRKNTDVLIIDASKGFEKVGKNNKLRARDIKKIADTFINRSTIPNYSKVVNWDEIRANEYNLNILRYVDSSAQEESFDIYATMFGGIPQSEIRQLGAYWEAFTTLKNALFDDVMSQYTHIKTDDVTKTITEHDDIKTFINTFDAAFGDFRDFLKEELLAQLMTLKIPKEQSVLSDAIFERLSHMPLIDGYEAYQLLDDNWHSIAVDVEIIQTEGFEATRQVDANMVLKKKNGKEEEVQEGWVGHIMPFSLVQETYLKEELEALRKKEHRLAEILAQYEEILESLSEEEKEANTIKESKDGFINAEVAKEAKELKALMKKKVKFEQDSYEEKILRVDALIEEEKALKKQLKADTEALHVKTKKTIETLEDGQVYELLELKWITPLVEALYKLPKGVIDNLTCKLQELANKYETTLQNIEDEIQKTAKELALMVEELDGDAFDMQGLQAFKALLEGDNASK